MTNSTLTTVKQSLSDVVLVLDFDGTLYRYPASIALAAAKLTNGKIAPRLNDVPQYDLVDCWEKDGFTQQLWDDAHLLTARSEEYHNLPPVNGSVEAIQSVRSAGAQVVVQTVRKGYTATLYDASPSDIEAIAYQTERWLEKYFNIKPREIFYVNPSEKKGRQHLPKKMQNRTIIFVDDALSQIDYLRREGEIALICGTTYNHDIPGLRFRSWGEFEMILEQAINEKFSI